MNRLFVFGCSYTNHDYPTWADFLSSYYDYYENWGKPGGGNRFIFNRLVECSYKRNIGPDDTVVICWSTPVREDRWFENRGWQCVGNVYNQNFYSKEWVENFFDLGMACMETINYCHAAQIILEKLNCKWKMIWFDHLDAGIADENKNTNSYLNLTNSKYKFLEYYKLIFKNHNVIKTSVESFNKKIITELGLEPLINYSEYYKQIFEDRHPSPIVGYRYVKDILARELGINFDIDKSHQTLALDWHNYLSTFPRTTEQPKYFVSGRSKYNSIPKIDY